MSLKAFKGLIRQADIFGYPVKFTYEKDKVIYKSLAGGVFSILLVLAILN